MTAKAPEPAKDSGPTAASTTGAIPAVPAAPAPAPVKAATKTAPRPAPKPKSSTGVAGGAFVVAVCALLVAIGAIAVSIYSLKVARDALSKNADRAAPTAVDPTTSSSAPVLAATPTITTSGPRVTYSSELVRAEVKIPAPIGCGAVYVDVDTLAIGNLNGHEFYLSACSPPLALRVDRSSGASSTSSNPSPELCGSQVAGTSTTSELVLPVRTGLTFCLLTSRTDATAQSLPQRLAVVEVTNVAIDNSVTVAISTYRVINP